MERSLNGHGLALDDDLGVEYGLSRISFSLTLYHVMACYQCLKFRVGCLNTFAYAPAVLLYEEPSLKATGLSGFVPLQAHRYRLHVVR